MRIGRYAIGAAAAAVLWGMGLDPAVAGGTFTIGAIALALADDLSRQPETARPGRLRADPASD